MGSPHGRARAPAPMTEAQAATTAEVPDIFCSKLDTSLIAARCQWQTNMDRQSVWHPVFRLDGSAHRLDIAAGDR